MSATTTNRVYESPALQSPRLNVGGTPRVPSPAEVAERIVVRIGLWQRRYRERCALRHLDERLARDAGFEMYEIEAEIAKPFWRA